MAPETEPTDEELQMVMREALDLALERQRVSDDWIRRKLAEEVARVKAMDGADTR
jgi:hypothetical protein